ncbi:MAG: SbcC/MukB-like Walker B domain-containing protein [Flammeovirgaceae bacterium]
MLPLKLTIQGLYSYKEKQTIDFEKLTSNQLFGIFGAVGSGKSSILEAIMFVLFEQSERLNSKENRYYNMMNLQSNFLSIDFECLTGKNSKELYRFVFEAKRSNSFEKVHSQGRKIYKWDTARQKWEATAQKSEDILGMKYEHFKNTVIIPQGKFRDFIEKKATDRTEMLQELFQLHQFDLAEKVKTLSLENKSSMDLILGNLQAVKNYSEENLLIHEQTLTDLKNHLEKQITQLLEKQNLLKNIENSLESKKELEQKTKELQIIENQKYIIEQKAQNLKKYQYVFANIREKLATKAHLDKLYAQYEIDVVKLQKNLEHAQTDKDDKKRKLDEAEKNYKEKGEKEKKIIELENIIEARKIAIELETVKRNAEIAENELIHLKQKQDEVKKLIQQKEQEIDDIRKYQIEGKMLFELSDWYSKSESLEKEYQLIQKQFEEYHQEMQKYELEKTNYLREQGFEAESLMDFTDSIQSLELKEKACLVFESETLKEIEHLNLQVRIADLRQSLEEGEPCPVCGSTEHDLKVVSNADLSQNLQEKRTLLEEKKKQLQHLQKVKLKLIQIASYFGKARLKKEELEFELSEKKASFDRFQSTFYWVEYSPQDKQKVKDLINSFGNQQKQFQAKENELTQLRKNQEEFLAKYQSLQERFNASLQQISALEARIFERKATVRILNFETLYKREISELQNNLSKGKSEIALLEENYKKAQNDFHLSELHFQNSQNLLFNEQESSRKLVKDMNRIDTEIEDAIKQFPDIQSIDEAINLLKLKLNTEQEQQEINAYWQKYNTLKVQIEEISKKIGNQLVDEEMFDKLKQEVEVLQKSTENLRKNIGATENIISEHKSKIEEKKKLIAQMEKLAERRDNLQILQALFTAKGFVNFVSSVYLNNLVNSANQRFTKLTHHHLSLEIGQDNEFIVRDYLNDGKTRLLKTLSGGQLFQASLCLALALAENVKSLNQAEKSFFFLDEGFGTLDKESLKIVFETLKSLQKENRIVGIISHIEELQQEIEVFIKVKKDTKRGSLVEESWETS